MMPPIHFRQPENKRSAFGRSQNGLKFWYKPNAPHTFQPIIRFFVAHACLCRPTHPHRGLFQSKGLSDLRASRTRSDGATG